MFDILTKHYQNNCSGFEIDSSQVLSPTKIKLGSQVISMFSSFLNFDMVQDIVISELEVELMFPMDEESEKYFQNLIEV